MPKPILTCVMLAGLVCSLFLSCKKSDPQPLGENERINDWVLDSMRVYYYWNNSLPKSPDLSPQPLSFFETLKNKHDRFSRLLNPDIASSYQPTLAYTFGIDIVSFTHTDGFHALITNVIPGSEAEELGLKRGDRVLSVNGTNLSEANTTQSVQNALELGRLELSTDQLTVNLTGSVVSDKPVYLYKTISFNSHKAGYLFLNAFEERAIPDLQRAFAYFKAQQVDEFILDLRYNPGGEVTVAAYLAALLAENAAPGSVFAEFRGNANAGVRRSTFADEINRIPPTYNAGFSELSTLRPGISKVYIITGRHTGSAAEMLINCLRPYINIITVGETTLGKDMASFAITDRRNPVQIPKWSIHPMIFKLYNANKQGDYAGGLQPDISVNELSDLPLRPFGDENDILIKAVTDNLQGKTTVSKKVADAGTSAVGYDSRSAIDANAKAVEVVQYGSETIMMRKN